MPVIPLAQVERATLCLPVVLLGVSCASASVSPRPATDPSDGDRADPCDICVLQQSDGLTGDDDGCPEPNLRLTDACALSPDQEAILSRVAPQLVANAHLTTVRVVSGRAACASAVRVALERLDLPPTRVEVATRGAESSVTLEVGAWDGKRCEL